MQVAPDEIDVEIVHDSYHVVCESYVRQEDYTAQEHLLSAVQNGKAYEKFVEDYYEVRILQKTEKLVENFEKLFHSAPYTCSVSAERKDFLLFLLILSAALPTMTVSLFTAFT